MTDHLLDPLAGCERYAPGSDAAKDLFRLAARTHNVKQTMVHPLLSEAWADLPELHKILARESGGFVGRPNYTYGIRSKEPVRWKEVHEELRHGIKGAKSTATGLGQLILDNVRQYYPSGAHGVGVALEEAIGMLRYIQARYGDPVNAWAQYGKNGEGY